jgi:Zn-dependent protease
MVAAGAAPATRLLDQTTDAAVWHNWDGGGETLGIVLWLAVFGVGFWVSVAIHEAGHVVVGLRNGWEVAGFYFKPAALGIGVRMGHRSTDPVDWNIGPVALAGPVASFFAAAVFWSIEPLPDGGGVLGALAGINLAVAVVNLLPTPITDGGHILRGLFGWTLRWRHMAVAWVLLELGGAALFLLLGYRVA